MKHNRLILVLTTLISTQVIIADTASMSEDKKQFNSVSTHQPVGSGQKTRTNRLSWRRNTIDPTTIFVPVKFISFESNRGCTRGVRAGH